MTFRLSVTVTFRNPADGPKPPVLQFIADKTRAEGQQLGFVVEASDPNGTIPMLSASPLYNIRVGNYGGIWQAAIDIISENRAVPVQFSVSGNKISVHVPADLMHSPLAFNWEIDTFSDTSAGDAPDGYAVLNLIYPLIYDYDVSAGEKTLVTVENTSDTDAVVAKVMFRSYPSDAELLGFFVYLLPGDSWTGEVREMSEKPLLYSTDENALSGVNTWASASTPINQQFFTHECSSLFQPPCNPLTGRVHIYGVFAAPGIADRNALLQACPFTVYDSADFYHGIADILTGKTEQMK